MEFSHPDSPILSVAADNIELLLVEPANFCVKNPTTTVSFHAYLFYTADKTALLELYGLYQKHAVNQYLSFFTFLNIKLQGLTDP